MADWLTPEARNVVLYMPPVHGMEMMRYGIFGHHMTPHFDYFYPLAFSAVCLAFGLLLCRRVRAKLVVE
jgi:capsular polysaccharide transport system permease protein